ncbi:uncharacterized protein BYT42DRAFT_558810 [Radiomyces spectabilis]|uniref:uncharacterized protein n=1 Tax=Radiomyces spectabilis TaxID=64574 RepID=UPI00221E3CC4|nr:uncharacterized protein BYT42DRAFT_558810 [Radiomyces spectabilis]KAI8388058.1 hypothetical protein BYT42DRAFT_558810 [Radiomyces spectabilis]
MQQETSTSNISNKPTSSVVDDFLSALFAKHPPTPTAAPPKAEEKPAAPPSAVEQAPKEPISTSAPVPATTAAPASAPVSLPTSVSTPAPAPAPVPTAAPTFAPVTAPTVVPVNPSFAAPVNAPGNVLANGPVSVVTSGSANNQPVHNPPFLSSTHHGAKRERASDEFDDYTKAKRQTFDNQQSYGRASRSSSREESNKRSGSSSYQRFYNHEINWDMLAPGSCMLIQRLPNTIEKQDLMDRFSRYGEILDVTIKHSGDCLVQFKNPAICTAAVSGQNGRVLKGVTLELQVCPEKPSVIHRGKAPDYTYRSQSPSHGSPSQRSDRYKRNTPSGSARFDSHDRTQSSEMASSSNSRRDRKSEENARNLDYRDNDWNSDIRDEPMHEAQPEMSTRNAIPNRDPRLSFSPSSRDRVHRDAPMAQPTSLPGPSTDSNQPMKQPTAAPSAHPQKQKATNATEHSTSESSDRRSTVQIITWSNIDRGFVQFVENSFKEKGFTISALFLRPGEAKDELIKELIVAGVKAVIVLDAQNIAQRKVYFQIFDYDDPSGNIHFDEYASISVQDAVAVLGKRVEVNPPPVAGSSAGASAPVMLITAFSQPSRNASPGPSSSRKRGDSSSGSADTTNVATGSTGATGAAAAARGVGIDRSSTQKTLVPVATNMLNSLLQMVQTAAQHELPLATAEYGDQNPALTVQGRLADLIGQQNVVTSTIPWMPVPSIFSYAGLETPLQTPSQASVADSPASQASMPGVSTHPFASQSSAPESAFMTTTQQYRGLPSDPRFGHPGNSVGPPGMRAPATAMQSTAMPYSPSSSHLNYGSPGVQQPFRGPPQGLASNEQLTDILGKLQALSQSQPAPAANYQDAMYRMTGNYP